MNQYIVTFVVSAVFIAGPVCADSLSELKGLENIGSGSSKQSPSQVVILNHTPNQTQDQKTDVENTSSQKYRARSGWGNGDSLEALRETRINKEAKNEQVLMEKLEHSRMEDEKSRLRRLFKIREYNRRKHMEMGDDDYEFGSVESDYESETTYAPVKKVKKVINVVSVPSADVQTKHAHITPDAPTSTYGGSSYTSVGNHYGPRPYYIKGQLGFGNYSASNATSPIGTSSWGIAAGKNLNRRWLVEIGVYKTSYEINDPGATPVITHNNFYPEVSQNRDLEQYNFSGLLGFKAIDMRGFVGSLRGGVSYVRRNSESSDIAGFQSFRSNTIDGLMGIGVDVEVAENIMITASYDYYTNLMNDLASTNSDVVERVETADYSVLGLGLQFKF